MSFYNIPASQSFADILAAHCQAESERLKIPLSQFKIFLPTRRGCRTLQDAFLNLSKGKARLLPIMQSIGDADIEEMTFANSDTVDIPPAISAMQRQLVLARLLKTAWPHNYNFQQALIITNDLGQLIDQIHTEGLDIDNLSNIIQEKELAQYWEITTKFLKMVLQDLWPAYLDEQGQIDPGLQRKLRIESLTNHYRNNPSETPVIMAGSTGSIPVTRKFIKTIGQMDMGQVILPAVDTVMDDATWFEVQAGHPQYLLKNLMTYCDIKRADLINLADDQYNENQLFLSSEMMRPAVTTDKWKRLDTGDYKNNIIQSMKNITLCEAENDHHEASVISLSMLEIASDPDQEKTAVLITPDRYLAMRVQANLCQWGVDIDDSAGTSLTNMPIGHFTLSVIKALQNNQIDPVTLLSCLKSPMAGGGDFKNFRTHVQSFENSNLRGVRPRGDIASLRHNDKSNPEFISHLENIFSPLSKIQTGAYSVKTFIQSHIQALENLASTPDMSGAQRLWIGEDGEALSQFFIDLQAQSDICPNMTIAEYADLIEMFLSKQSVSARYGKHPRLSILGQIEARMIKADRVILSGLNEGIWPANSGFDAWMSRDMRTKFELPSLEQKITLSAHDFATAFCSGEVILTRSQKSGGQPTLPSRWLERMNTVLSAANIDPILRPHHKGQKYAFLANYLRQVDAVQPIERPQPKPSLDKRPSNFSVTEIEKWMRDPYWIYARKILDFHPLKDVDMALSVADRGTLIHKAIEVFTKKYPNKNLPDNALDDLLSIGKDHFNTNDTIEVHGFWWPRFVKAANWFVDHEKTWRGLTQKIHTELKSTMEFTVNNVAYTLTGKADRIEIRTDNAIAIIDYKTGSAPKSADVNMGISSQLPLEGLMINNGVFDVHTDTYGNDFHLQYWSLSGTKGGGEAIIAQGKKGASSAQLIEESNDGLRALITAYQNESTPYIASPNTMTQIKVEYNDYAHLERIAEWSVENDAEGDV